MAAIEDSKHLIMSIDFQDYRHSIVIFIFSENILVITQSEMMQIFQRPHSCSLKHVQIKFQLVFAVDNMADKLALGYKQIRSLYSLGLGVVFSLCVQLQLFSRLGPTAGELNKIYKIFCLMKSNFSYIFSWIIWSYGMITIIIETLFFC